MFTDTTIENFKPWKSASIKFGKITGLFGANSSGKTSLIQFLLLLKQTMHDNDRRSALALNGPYLDLGTITDILHRHDEGQSIAYQVNLQLPESLDLNDPSLSKAKHIEKSDRLGVDLCIRSSSQIPYCYNLSYKLGESSFWLAEDEGKKNKYILDTKNASNFRFIRNQGRKWELPGPVKSYQFPDQARTYFQNSGFLSDLEYEFEYQLYRLFYLGPLRQKPLRNYFWPLSTPVDVGIQGEYTIDALLSAQEEGETRNLRKGAKKKPFVEIVAHWLRVMGLAHNFQLTEIAKGSSHWRAIVQTGKSSSEVLLPDVGFGVSQVLPVITLLNYAPEYSTVVLEQPEIHLHPLAQAELADLIIYAATHRNIQVILESHSEHLLLRLQRRIAEGELSSDDVRLYFCSASNSHSKLLELGLDHLGNLSEWPTGFMGDSFNEAAEAELARLRRAGGGQK